MTVDRHSALTTSATEPRPNRFGGISDSHTTPPPMSTRKVGPQGNCWTGLHYIAAELTGLVGKTVEVRRRAARCELDIYLDDGVVATARFVALSAMRPAKPSCGCDARCEVSWDRTRTSTLREATK